MTIRSKAASRNYLDGWDRIFGSKFEAPLAHALIDECRDVNCPYFGQHKRDACAHHVDRREE